MRASVRGATVEHGQSTLRYGRSGASKKKKGLVLQSTS